MFRAPDAVCIDLDGTLSDTDSSLAAGVAGAAAKAADLFDVDESSWAAANGSAASEVWSAGAQDWILGRVSALELSTQIYARTLELVGKPTSFAPDLVLAHAIEAKAGMRLYDDADEFLSAASAQGIKLALITNGASETQRTTISQLGLEQRFEVIIVSSEVGFKKPDPRIFAKATAALGKPDEGVWHIGDSVHDDVSGAASAGLQPVWLNRGASTPSGPLPHSAITIRSLGELLPMLKPSSD